MNLLPILTGLFQKEKPNRGASGYGISRGIEEIASGFSGG